VQNDGTSPCDHLVEAAQVAELELLAFGYLHLGITAFGVAADLDAAAGIDLGHAHGDGLAPQGGRFAGGENQAGIGHRQAQDGDDAQHLVVADLPARIDLHAGGRTQAWEGDGVRTAAVAVAQVGGVGDQTQHLEAPVVEAEQGAQADVIAARAHRSAEPGQAPAVVGLARPGRMQAGVGRVVIGLLEDLPGADACRLDRAVAGLVHRGGVDVDPADLAVAALHAVDRADALSNEVGIVVGMLAVDQDQALVPLILQGLDLMDEFLLIEGPADRRAVGRAEAAVGTVVHALVADVERREQDDAVAVDIALQATGGFMDLGDLIRIGDQAQAGRLGDRQRLLGQRAGQQVGDFRLIRGRPGQEELQGRIIDEIRIGISCEFGQVHGVLSAGVSRRTRTSSQAICTVVAASRAQCS